MGQNSSNHVSSPRVGEKRTQSQRPGPAHNKPAAPILPNHVVPENKVLHNGSGTMGRARSLLRPVSKELTNLHPEYADLFQYGQQTFELGGESHREAITKGDNDKENSELKFGGSSNARCSENADNSEIKSLERPVNTDDDTALRRQQISSNLRRSNSVDNRFSNAIPLPRHRRQASLTAGTYLQATTIPEDPREHLYNITRHEPFSNNMPSSASLPMKNSFEGDYSMNLTYAQLAEYRRQKRLDELEEKTGKKLKEMSAEISASNTVPKSPFDRQNFVSQQGSKSSSTRSSGTGLSKSKKKKAPPPPIPADSTPRRDQSPGSLSLTTEPPVDYDMDDMMITSASRQSRPVQRNNSRISNSFKISVVSENTTIADQARSSAKSQEKYNAIGIPATVPPAPPVPTSFSKPVTMSVVSTSETQPIENKSASKLALQKSLTEAKEQLEALKKLEDVLKNYRTTDDKESNKPTVNQATVDPPSENNSSGFNTSSNYKPMKLSSLLQHDIMLAAKARGSKQMKSKPPVVLEKPKDAAQLFREELAKAANERANRRQQRNDSDDRNSDELSVSSNENKENNGNTKILQDSDQDMISVGSNLSFEKKQPNQVENISLSSSTSGSQRVFSSNWTPEDDLGSDEDIANQSYTRPDANISTEGFKSSLIPSKIKELKNYTPRQEKKITKQSSRIHNFHESEQKQNDNEKFGSMRKFRRSVHEGMKNAFGSISKASGKLLKKQKSCDFMEASDHQDQGGSLTRDSVRGILPHPEGQKSGNYKGSHRRSGSDGNISYTHYLSDSDISDIDSDEDDIGDIDFASGIEDPLSTRQSKKSNVSGDMGNLKRAGVAYVNKDGEIFVLPEKTDKLNDGKKKDEGGLTPRLYKKKDNKRAYDSPRKHQERYSLEESLSKELIEKEKQLEEDRKRQREIERDFLRLRDLETQERLRHQIAMLQQQQMDQAQVNLNNNTSEFMQMGPMRHSHNEGSTPNSYPPTDHQNVHSSFLSNGKNGYATGMMVQNHPSTKISAPHMTTHRTSSATSFPTTILGQPISNSSFTTSPFVTHTSPMIGGGIGSVGTPSPFPNLTSQDLIGLSDYMTTMGVAPPSTDQQWAVLLSTVRINTPSFQSFNNSAENHFPYGTTRRNVHGPNLSSIFGGGGEKTLQKTLTVIDAATIDIPTNFIDRDKEINKDAPPSYSNVYSKDPSLTTESSPITPHKNGHTYVLDNANVQTERNPLLSKDNNNPVISNDASSDYNKIDISQALVLSKVLDNEEQSSKSAQISCKPVSETLPTKRSPTLSPKVYGPIGFRPVVFNSTSS